MWYITVLLICLWHVRGGSGEKPPPLARTRTPSPPSVLPDPVPANTLWSTFARDCKDLNGQSQRLGAARNAVGSPSRAAMLRIARSICSDAPNVTWVSDSPRLCYLDAFFGTDTSPGSSGLVRVADAANITILVLSRGTVRPIIDAVDLILIPPPSNATSDLPGVNPDPGTPTSPIYSSGPSAPTSPLNPSTAVTNPTAPINTSSKEQLLSAAVTWSMEFRSGDGKTVSLLPPSVADALAEAGIDASDSRTPVLMPVFRSSTATMAQLSVQCPGWNAWPMALHRSAPVVSWFPEALVLGVRVTVRGAGAALQNNIIMPGLGAVGLGLKAPPPPPPSLALFPPPPAKTSRPSRG
ncbi:hypothetical protein Vretimale_16991 [Volvox reticuliferus]|nr:hypothetical protein Vretimale_16991 [Volvox reticuliferus]